MPDPAINYGALLDLIKSGDPRGMQAAGKLTPNEQQEFFNFQTQATKGQDFERTRIDNTSPEMLMMAGAGGSMLGAAGQASGAIGKTKAAYDSLHPIVKYEALKGLLGYFGVPGASAIAALASGRGAKAPAAAAEAAPATAAAPAPPEPSIQGIPISELRRLGIGENAINATLRGPTPRVAPSPVAAPPMAPPQAQAPMASPFAGLPSTLEEAVQNGAKMKLSAAELPEFQRLVGTGKSAEEALGLIQAQRDFATRFGLPSPTAVKGSVADRNATGRWPQP